jgi:hypothetical protein
MKEADYVAAAKSYMKRNEFLDIKAAKNIMKAMIGLEGCSIGVSGEPLRAVDADGARVVLRGLNILSRKKRP